MADLIQVRRDTKAHWNTANTVLADGELGFETDTKRFKLGDGTKAWNSLEYYEVGGGGGSYSAPTWSGYVGASNATEKENVNLNNLTSYSNKSGSVSITISSTSYLWFAVNREVRIESFGIEVPVQYMGIGAQNGLYYYKTVERIRSSINVELIATDVSQGDDSGGGDTPTPTPTAQKPMIVTPPQSATYNEGANPNDLTVVASVSDGGTLSFQWYKDNSPFGSADSGTAVSNGVQSSITPTSETATYYCVITNSKSGANSNTNQTTSVTITFSESSETEETDLTGFTLDTFINSSGVEEANAEYCITPWYTVTGEGSIRVCFVNMIVNSSSSSPKYTYQIKNTSDVVTSYEKTCGGRRISVTAGNKVRFVMKRVEIDSCFVNIGGNYVWKGSKVKNDFLSMMGTPFDYFGRAFHRNTGSGTASLIDKSGAGNLSGEYAATWVTKPIELISGHDYNFYVGWINSQSATDKYIITSEQLTTEGGAYVTGAWGAITTGITVKGSETNKYLYCNFSLQKLQNCYVKDITSNTYLIKGSNVE